MNQQPSSLQTTLQESLAQLGPLNPLPKIAKAFPLLQRFFGYALVVIGTALLIFIMMELYNVYQNLENVSFIHTIVNWLTGQPLLLEREETPAFILGKGSALITAIVLFLMFASLCASTAGKLITSGVQLLIMPAKSSS